MKYQIFRIQDFQVLKDDVVANPSYFILCQLEDSIGGIKHAITIHNNLIFDGNETTPLPLTKASLDRCCESGDANITWKGVIKAYRYSKNM
jgi:hypothetical protein